MFSDTWNFSSPLFADMGGANVAPRAVASEATASVQMLVSNDGSMAMVFASVNGGWPPGGQPFWVSFHKLHKRTEYPSVQERVGEVNGWESWKG